MTHRERQALDFIRAYQERHGGTSPSFDEIREALGLGSKSGVARVVTALERQRLVRRDPVCARSIVLTDRPVDLTAVTIEQLLAELNRRVPLGTFLGLDCPVHAADHGAERAVA